MNSKPEIWWRAPLNLESLFPVLMEEIDRQTNEPIPEVRDAHKLALLLLLEEQFKQLLPVSDPFSQVPTMKIEPTTNDIANDDSSISEDESDDPILQLPSF